jgi:formylglycine-generating enzyme required for sulfatase activity
MPVYLAKPNGKKLREALKETHNPWGEDQPNCEYLNYNDCLEHRNQMMFVHTTTHKFLRSHGYVGKCIEWVSDWYQEDYYSQISKSNPQGPDQGTKKVYRGGIYKTPEDQILPYLRYSTEPDKYAADLGFRCVLVGDTEESLLNHRHARSLH